METNREKAACCLWNAWNSAYPKQVLVRNANYITKTMVKFIGDGEIASSQKVVRVAKNHVITTLLGSNLSKGSHPKFAPQQLPGSELNPRLLWEDSIGLCHKCWSHPVLWSWYWRREQAPRRAPPSAAQGPSYQERTKGSQEDRARECVPC